VTDWDRFFDQQYLRTYVPRQRDVDSAAQAHAAVALAGCPAGGDVLDCPCGYGRHSLPAAEAGYRVVGADRSETMLAEARERAGERGWPRWVRADYRDLPFADASFDCVLNLFTSIGYHGDEGDREACAEFRRVLRPGGSLVLETMHRDRLARIFQPRRWDPLPDDGLLVEEGRFDLVSGTNEVEQTYVAGDGARHTFSYRIRTYTVTELDAMLREAGFAEVEHFGGYEREPLTWDTRLLALARAGSSS
jgi:ubiquinone/menaquinone biosynthesis C-methylase UbiE